MKAYVYLYELSIVATSKFTKQQERVLWYQGYPYRPTQRRKLYDALSKDLPKMLPDLTAFGLSSITFQRRQWNCCENPREETL